MSNENVRVPKDKLIRNTGIAALIAIVLLLTIILPAEYDIDPTGVGSVLGIRGLSHQAAVENVNAEIEESAMAAASPLHINHQPPLKFVDVDLVLEPYGQGEFKLKMQANARLSYLWHSGTDLVYADLHGHTLVVGEDGEEEIVVRYLETQEGTGESGQFDTPFGGDHGWYFLNLETRPINIRVQISGNFDSHEYIDIGPQI
ncbi:MAG: hypothetical protein CMQ11_09420 [Gammaproteobacteria bacterium]|jgi:hypothetical protein|nr:hypothetical protein [Gammaproteobacteria bacterium]MEC7369215.1 hypothetical protein [Pseudomonadota bacterium]